MKNELKIYIPIIIGMLAGLFILGSIGAYEVAQIDTKQFLNQMAIGVLTIISVVFYLKYINEKIY